MTLGNQPKITELLIGRMRTKTQVCLSLLEPLPIAAGSVVLLPVGGFVWEFIRSVEDRHLPGPTES